MNACHTPNDSGAAQTGKRCPRCGTEFFCDVAGNCWCKSVTLDAETLRRLRTEYVDCLCPTCLRHFESHKN